MNPAFVDWLRWNIPIIASVIAMAYASFIGVNAYLSWRDKRLKVQVELHVGPAISLASGTPAGRDMLVVSLRNMGVPTTIVGCQFQTTARDKKYRSSGEKVEPRPLGLRGRESLMYPPAFLAGALKRDGYRDVVRIRAIVADNTGARYTSDPVGLDIDWALRDEARYLKAMSTAAKARSDKAPQELRRDN